MSGPEQHHCPRCGQTILGADEHKCGRGTLDIGEPHPGYHVAMEYLRSVGYAELYLLLEAFASCAIEGNRTAEICAETLRRLLTHQTVSDRYIMGLAWEIWRSKNPK